MQQLPPRLVFAGGWRASLTLGMARLLIRSGLAPLVFAPVARAASPPCDWKSSQATGYPRKLLHKPAHRLMV